MPHSCLDPWGLAHNGVAKSAWLRWYGGLFLGHADRVIFPRIESGRKRTDGWQGWEFA